MKKIIQLGNFLSKGKSNYPMQGRIYSAHGCAPTVFNYADGGGANIKSCIMEVNILVNGAPMGVCRAIRASYGKCGFISLRLHTGQGITGVVNYKEEKL